MLHRLTGICTELCDKKGWIKRVDPEGGKWELGLVYFRTRDWNLRQCRGMGFLQQQTEARNGISSKLELRNGI